MSSSYDLSASTGWRFAARLAGENPEINPTKPRRATVISAISGEKVGLPINSSTLLVGKMVMMP
jgi:hypothetical protein